MTEKESPIKIIGIYAMILAAAFLYALSFHLLITPNEFAPAGISGIATMIQYKLDFSLGYMYLLVNIPLCVFVFFFVRRKFSLRTIVFVIAYSVMYLAMQNTDVFDRFMFISNGMNEILPALAAGAISGLVTGVMLSVDSCTGGTDILAVCIHHKHPDVSVAWMSFVINALVAVASYFVYAKEEGGVLTYNYEPVVLCIVYCLVSSKVTDVILAGLKSAIKFEVITDNPEAIARDVIDELHHTATVLPARGMYNNQEKQLLVCVISKHQVTAFRKILDRHPDTFAYISPVSETLGFFRKK